jgi:hypothetical protein
VSSLIFITVSINLDTINSKQHRSFLQILLLPRPNPLGHPRLVKMSNDFSGSDDVLTLSPDQCKTWENAEWETAGFFEDMTITDRFIRNSKFRGCKLVNVGLMNCEVLESTMENCIAIQCRFGRFCVMNGQEPKLETAQNELYAWKCGLQDCEVANMTLYNAEILFSIIAHCLVNTSYLVENVATRKTDFRNCKMEDIRLSYSGTDTTYFNCHECEIDESSKSLISNGTITKSPLAFNKFAPELRCQIFSYCLEWANTKARTPNLIIALRGDPTLYHEALDLFYKANTFNMSYENKRGRELMESSAFEGIQKLSLRYDS